MSCSFKQQFQCKRNKRYIHTKSTGVKWASRHKRLYREHLLWTWHNFYCVGDVICQLYSNIQQSSTQTSYFSWYLKFYTCRRCFAVTINFLRSFEGNYWRVCNEHLSKAYGHRALSEAKCRIWFSAVQRF